MNKILGFRDETEKAVQENLETDCESTEEKSVRSIVKVYFPDDGRHFDYYNDKFDLKERDRVFVSGMLEGIPGVVVSVNTKFKIRPSDYQKVISKADLDFHGKFYSLDNKMITYDNSALPPKKFRTWVMPPVKEDDEIICGDGYEANVYNLMDNKDISPAVYDRATGILRRGNVIYINVCEGEVTAFVKGTHVYEINFNLNRAIASQIYCDCPYPGFCKHTVAVLMNLKEIFENARFEDMENFTVIDRGQFWSVLSFSKQEIDL